MNHGGKEGGSYTPAQRPSITSTLANPAMIQSQPLEYL
jgi:hypothetical protein